MDAHLIPLTSLAEMLNTSPLVLTTTVLCLAVVAEETFQRLARLRSLRLDAARNGVE